MCPKTVVAGNRRHLAMYEAPAATTRLVRRGLIEAEDAREMAAWLAAAAKSNCKLAIDPLQQSGDSLRDVTHAFANGFSGKHTVTLSPRPPDPSPSSIDARWRCATLRTIASPRPLPVWPAVSPR